MLPFLVIGLREGLEASLIVGIIATFLRRQGRMDLLRWVFIGVGSAIVLCAAVGVALDLYSRNLPQRQQEGMETVIGLLAVGMVTYMVVWMKRHSRDLKGQLEGMASVALRGPDRAGRALVAMAFLAVLREGVETVVFLLAAFDASGDTADAAVGAILGIAAAVVLGYLIYSGGVRINLSKFFRVTGVVLVLVAAGLLVNAMHTAHEAGWLNAGQGSTLDLTWLVKPGTVQSSLLTGMFGVQQKPTLVEVLAWLAYVIPAGLFVAWPPGRGLARRTKSTIALAGGAVFAIVAVTTLIATPARPSTNATFMIEGHPASVVSFGDEAAVLRTPIVSPITDAVSAPATLTLHKLRNASLRGSHVAVYRGSFGGAGAQGRPATMSLAALAKIENGRLPIGLGGSGSSDSVRLRYHDTDVFTAWIDVASGQLVDLQWSETLTAKVSSPIGWLPLSRPLATDLSRPTVAETAAATAAARTTSERIDERSALRGATWWCGGLGLLALLIGALLRRPAAKVEEDSDAPVGTLLKS